MANDNPQNDGALAELAADPASRAAFLKKMGGGVAGADRKSTRLNSSHG